MESKECFWCDRNFNTEASTAGDKETYCTRECQLSAETQLEAVQNNPSLVMKTDEDAMLLELADSKTETSEDEEISEADDEYGDPDFDEGEDDFAEDDFKGDDENA